MKWLLDANVERAIVDSLQKLEPDTLWVPDRDSRMSDADVLDWSVRGGRCLVTSDKDFGALVLNARERPVGVVLLRLPGNGHDKAMYLESVWPRSKHVEVVHEADLRGAEGPQGRYARAP